MLVYARNGGKLWKRKCIALIKALNGGKLRSKARNGSKLRSSARNGPKLRSHCAISARNGVNLQIAFECGKALCYTCPKCRKTIKYRIIHVRDDVNLWKM